MTFFDKAIIGTITSSILSLLALVNITGDMTVEQAATAISTGLVTGIAVYLKPNA